MEESKRRTRGYSSEFKQGAVKLAISSSSVSGVAKELGIPAATLYSWVYKARMSGECVVTATDGTVNNVDVTKLLDENKSLRKRLSRLEQEKAILKKAAAYFAKELV